jgi:hypothetical protein
MSKESFMQQISSSELDFKNSTVVESAPKPGRGNWVGAANVLVHDGFIYLTYRNRQPIGEGRGGSTVVKKSPITDGFRFEHVATVYKEDMNVDPRMDATESLERPALDFDPKTQKWRLYLSCATTGTKDWRIEMLEADDPKDFSAATRKVVLAGDETVAIKDPVIVRQGDTVHMWPTHHPLSGDPKKDEEESDRMWSEHWISNDGVHWENHGKVLESRPGTWYGRGARITAVVMGEDGAPGMAFFDGRESGENYITGGNFEERTGRALWDKEQKCFIPTDDEPIQSLDGNHGLRYVCIADLGNGKKITYAEVTRPDEAHDIRAMKS